MEFKELVTLAKRLRELYERLEEKKYGRAWTTTELGLGFVGDMGDLAKLLQAEAGVRDIENYKQKLGHELSDCLWSLIVLADKCNIDLESEFKSSIDKLQKEVSLKLAE